MSKKKQVLLTARFLVAAPLLVFSLSACSSSSSPDPSTSGSASASSSASSSASPSSSPSPSATSTSPSSDPSSTAAGPVTRQEFVNGMSQLISQRSVGGQPEQAELSRFAGCVYEQTSGKLSEPSMRAIASAHVSSLPENDRQVMTSALQTCAETVTRN